MAEIKLTASQQAVVDNRGGALLVSAAAGSGKTKVLVDRLLRQICDPVTPCNIDDFLVITYTKAAAAELRIKIAQALSQRLALEPGNHHLQRQMHRIYLADISTVHAFCSGLLRTYAYRLDIPADFRVAEELESSILQDKVLEQLLETYYAGEDESFQAMVAAFGYGRDDRRLPEAIKMAHEQMRCRVDMDGWLQKMLDALDMSRYSDAAETPWGAYLLDEFRNFLQQQIGKMQRGLEEMQQYPNILKGLGTCFAENIEQLKGLLALESWDEICSGKVESFGRAGAIRKPEDATVKVRLAKLRTLCWSELKQWQEMFFGTSASVLQDLAETAPGTQALLKFAAVFDKAYAEEKKKRKLLDFSDLEHLAIQLLTDRYTGQPSSIAREIAKKFREIMVDEYQDSNEVQDTIFEAVSREGRNRFMVGDVKQSIYRFRLADPALFLRKYESYPEHTEAEEGMPRKILLSENFRSRPEILAACNDVFRLVMRKRVGDLDYGDAEALKAGGIFPPIPQTPVELHCLTNSRRDADVPGKTEQEAEYVAARIRRLLDEKTPVTDGNGTRPVRPGDIVILMRSISNTAGIYLDALARAGIPAACERGGSLLDTSEVQILVALLQVIDNPHQDIPLLTALASPVFGFTPDELAEPRTKNRKDDFFDTIVKEGGRFARFLSILEQLRKDAAWMNLHELMDSVFNQTGLLTVFAAMPDGVRRERNLLAFRSFAVSFEAVGSKALPQLLWYLADLQEKGGQLPMPKGVSKDAVTIMTIHSAKGLEFPVVFLCDLSRKFNLRDMQDAILVDNDLAVSCNHIDHERFVRYPTLAKKAMIRKKTREAVSEELRVLYVAMTRPKDMLIMTYYSKFLLSELKNINSQLTVPLSDDLCASPLNHGKWLLMVALCRTEAGELLNLVEGNEVSRVWDTTWKVCFRDLAVSEEEAVLPECEAQQAELQKPDEDVLRLLQLEYPFEKSAAIPAKITATQLKGRMLDQEAAEGAEELRQTAAYHFQRPNFLPRKLTAAEKGVATHLFLQFADYRACAEETSVRAELERMQAEAFLTPEQAEAVQIDHILRFFRSELGWWLVGQKNVRREFKFSLLVDGAEYSLDTAGEQVMLQGVVDCFVLEQDGITILDFKTDRVREDTAERVEYYRPQLEAYASALQQIYELPVKNRILYFFAVGRAVYL